MEKPKVVSVVSHKGGSGKSSSVITAGNYLAKAGKSLLFLDGDYSNSTTQYSLKNIYGRQRNGLAAAIKKGRLSDNIIPTGRENIDIIPSDRSIEEIKIKDDDTLKRLMEGESSVLSVYDYIIIDTSQGYNTITANAIAASDMILTPLMMCQFDLMSCLALQSKIAESGKYEAWRLFFNGVNPHILNPNSASYQYMALYRKAFNNCLEIYIPRTTAVVNAIDRDMKITRKVNEKLYTAVRELAGVIAGEELPEVEWF
jgi:chromosome partitioning protein